MAKDANHKSEHLDEDLAIDDESAEAVTGGHRVGPEGGHLRKGPGTPHIRKGPEGGHLRRGPGHGG